MKTPRLAAAVLAGALALSACGASRDAQTYQERSNADGTNTAVGPLALRGIVILPPEDGRTHEVGGEALVALTVTNADDEPDQLVSVTTDAASTVEVLAQNRPATLRVPSLGSTGNAVTLRMVGLTEELTEGEYATFTFTFERAGTVEVPVAVGVSGRTDRPVYTGEEGSEEGEPALQAPAGGHHSEDEGADEPTTEGDTADLAEPEEGAGTGAASETSDEQSEGASTTDGAEPASSPAA